VDASWTFCPGCGTRREPYVEGARSEEPLVGETPERAEPRRKASQHL
jgi:uncharacterized Zn finger protein (UPF0148 family)